MEKPNPKDFGYTRRYGWTDKIKLQAYRRAMSEYQKIIYEQKERKDNGA